MKINRFYRPLWVCALLFTCTSVSLAQTPSIEDFVKHPRFEGGKISPSGKYLALTRRKNDVQGILVVNLEAMKVESGTHFGEYEDVWDFSWANDERLLIEPALRIPATMSYKAPTGELIGMNADGSNLKRLSGFRLRKARTTGTLIYSRNPITEQGEVFDIYSQDKDYVLVQAGSTQSRGGYTRAYLLNINNGKTRVVGRSKTRFGSFIADATGLPTVNFGANDDNETEIYFRDNKEEGFELLRKSSFGHGSVIPIGKATGGEDYYVLESITGNTMSLSIWRPDNAQPFTPIFRHPQVDVDSVVTGGNTDDIIAVKFHDPLPNYYYLDENLPLVRQHKRLREENPNRDVIIESVTEDMSRAVINITGDVHPSIYYLLDVATGNMEKIFTSRPELQTSNLAAMQPVTIPARDGLSLQGFLTLPPDQKAEKNLPLIVLVHGGPYGLRDLWGYDFEVQLLASRGYAVLQVNYRGSGGWGLEFQAAGIGQWGTKMQDDLTDATRWAIEQGIAAEDRICIYGSSYGGYAALMGAVREPDLYQCAIGYGGVYDLNDLFDRGAIQASNAGVSYLSQVLGRDQTELAARSPFNQAKKIRAKVFIAHGGKDTIAPYKQAKNMRKALQNAGNNPEYFIEKREGHGFFGLRPRIRYYNKLLEFLDETIGDSSQQNLIGWADVKLQPIAEQ